MICYKKLTWCIYIKNNDELHPYLFNGVNAKRLKNPDELEFYNKIYKDNMHQDIPRYDFSDFKIPWEEETDNDYVESTIDKIHEVFCQASVDADVETYRAILKRTEDISKRILHGIKDL